jgi:hypothetical protein
MALVTNRLGDTLTQKARSKLGIRFGRFTVAAIAAFATTEVVLKETLPFWIVSAMVVVILLLATKFAYHSAGWMNLTGVERVLYVDAVYGMANIGTFLLRFLFFHYVLFAASVVKDPPGAAEEALASTDPGPEPFARATESDRPGEDADEDEDLER